jgi:maltooligosyltrehalose trehalohydrolase
VSHSDPGLIDAVRDGRRREFGALEWANEPPDPQAESTFLGAKLNHPLRDQGRHRVLVTFYRELIRLRKTIPALATLNKENMEVRGYEAEMVLAMRRWYGEDEILAVFNLGPKQASVSIPISAGRLKKLIDSADSVWQSPGSVAASWTASEGGIDLVLPSWAFVLLKHEKEM